jgi:hypothetical protein
MALDLTTWEVVAILIILIAAKVYIDKHERD